jgi:predicted nucleotidyltransferase
MSSRTEIAAAREQQREALLARARLYVERLRPRLALQQARVVGSVARGDFNVWSDVDVLVVAEGLPTNGLERLTLLTTDAPGGVQPHGYTPEELRRAEERRDPLVLEAGIALCDR